MIANSTAGLHKITGALNKITEEYGKRLNIKKTYMMRISTNEAKQMKKLKNSIDGNILEQLKQLCHLGSILADDRTCHTEIIRRIAKGKNALRKRNELLRGKMNIMLKKRRVIRSVVLYGSETWILIQEDMNRPQAFEM